MSPQLVVSINSDADDFRWCWLSNGQVQSAATGNLDALRAALNNVAQHAWLLLPGAKVVTRQLEYTEKEKKHLRNLFQFQFEESVVGDIDDLHVAIGAANAGKVVLAYTDKQWLKSIFNQFANIGIEVTRCWSSPLLLPLDAPLDNQAIEPTFVDSEPDLNAAVAVDPLALNQEDAVIEAHATWVLALAQGQVNLRFAEQEGFSVPLAVIASVLNMLVASKKLTDKLPALVLRASEQSELEQLLHSLPESLVPRVKAQLLTDDWLLDFDGKAIDLCQAEFSQRLPLERWMKLWRGVGILALVTLITYVGVLGFHIYKLNKQNLQLRQQMEAIYRSVVPNGQSDDPEKRLRLKLQQLQPKVQTGSLMPTLAGVLPLIAASQDIVVKVISYSAETGDLSISVQAHSFSSLDALRQSLIGQGYSVDPIVANTQGDISTGRLKISKPQQH
jgi:general secretion pathway protein L